ncbi:protein kinase domain-containing protein [Thalassoroseus pseudoceratinae]|uniref:protein kinase domain-containing protein n=1 Tax=Thalassoroseus pseudoceratinae TaxID=2713176 RepID=UPI00141F003A|nr:protein kinase [Thalassoroseus pseudoceratinae]
MAVCPNCQSLSQDVADQSLDATFCGDSTDESCVLCGEHLTNFLAEIEERFDGADVAEDDDTLQTCEIDSESEEIEDSAEMIKTVKNLRPFLKRPSDPTMTVDSPSDFLSDHAEEFAVGSNADSGETLATSPSNRQGPTPSTHPDFHADDNTSSVLKIGKRVLEPSEHAVNSDYELLDKLGEGGMGVVYAGRQSSIDRAVAIKTLKKKAAGQQERTSFVSEAVVTGDLDHPNIVPIYDLGTDQNGSLFYSMKQVQGTPWLKVIDEKSEEDNLSILMRVADAIAFAHSRGVVHCDLKPENVMLGSYGEVLVMDWGLAQLMPDFAKPEDVARSAAGGGTPAYMAPEMAGGTGEVGYHSDVYLLGAILFEIVVGKPPHTGTNVMQCLYAAAENLIRETEVTGPLLDIALTAMATDPQDRYGSVSDFQSAIREYLSHAESRYLAERAELVLGQAEQSQDYQLFSQALASYREALSFWDENPDANIGVRQATLSYANCAFERGDYDLALSLLDGDEMESTESVSALRPTILKAQAERDSRQHRLKQTKRILACLALITVCGAVFAAITINDARMEADHQRQLAVDEAEVAAKAQKQAEAQRKIAIAERGKAETARSNAENARDVALAERERAEAATKRANKATERAVAAQKLEEKAKLAALEAKALEEQAKEEALTARALEEKAKEQALRAKTLEEQAKQEAMAARAAEAYESYVAQIQLAATKIDEQAFGVALSLLDACRPQKGETDQRGWEWARLMHLCHQSRRTIATKAPVDALAYSPDGSRFVAATWNSQAGIYDAESGELLVRLRHDGQYVHDVCYSPDGRLIATGSNDPNGPVRIWDAQTGRPIRSIKGHTDAVLDVEFSPDGERLLSSSYDNTARLWDWKTGEPLQQYVGHFWWVWSASFSPDGLRIVTGSQDGTAIVWDVETAEKIAQFNDHKGPVFVAKYAPDSQHVVTADNSGHVLIWHPDELPKTSLKRIAEGRTTEKAKYRELDGHTAAVRCVEFSRDGRFVLAGSDDNSVILWSVKADRVVDTFQGHAGWVRSCAMSPDGRSIVSGSQDGHIKQWDIGGGDEIRVLGGHLLDDHTEAVLAGTFSPDGRWVATAGRDKSVRIADVRTGTVHLELAEGHNFLTQDVRFSPDGRWLFTSAFDNSVHVWDLAKGTEALQFHGSGRESALAVSHDGRWLITGSDHNAALLWDLKSEAIRTAMDHTKQSLSTPTRKLVGHRSPVRVVAFSHDDSTIYTGDSRGRGRLWDAATGKLLYTLEGHSAAITDAEFQHDDAYVVTTSRDKTATRWNVRTGRERRDDILKHPAPVLAMELFADGRHAITSCEDGQLRIWQLDPPEVVTSLKTENAVVETLHLSNSQTRVIGVQSVSGNVSVWNLTTNSFENGGKPEYSLDSFPAEAGTLRTARFAPDGLSLVTVAGNDVKLWNTETQRPLTSFNPTGTVAAIAFSPDGKRLAAGSWDDSVRIWDLESGRAISKLAGIHRDDIQALAYSPDGLLLASADSDGLVVLWDAATGDTIREFLGHSSTVRSVVFSADGQQLLTGSTDRTARIWDIKTGKEQCVLRGHRWAVNTARFDAANQRVLTVSDDETARVWQLTKRNAEAFTAELLQTITGHTAGLTGGVFSPDGRRLVTASRDNTAKVWDAQNGQELLTLKGHTRGLTSISFSPDGAHLLSTSQDGTAILWLTGRGLEADREVQSTVSLRR